MAVQKEAWSSTDGPRGQLEEDGGGGGGPAVPAWQDGVARLGNPETGRLVHGSTVPVHVSRHDYCIASAGVWGDCDQYSAVGSWVCVIGVWLSRLSSGPGGWLAWWRLFREGTRGWPPVPRR